MGVGDGILRPRLTAPLIPHPVPCPTNRSVDLRSCRLQSALSVRYGLPAVPTTSGRTWHPADCLCFVVVRKKPSHDPPVRHLRPCQITTASSAPNPSWQPLMAYRTDRDGIHAGSKKNALQPNSDRHISPSSVPPLLAPRMRQGLGAPTHAHGDAGPNIKTTTEEVCAISCSPLYCVPRGP